MANLKSAQKRARQEPVKKARNLARKTAVKTAIKKVVSALEKGDIATAQTLFKEAQAKIARARGKGLLHANTAARKVSRLAKLFASTARAQ